MTVANKCFLYGKLEPSCWLYRVIFDFYDPIFLNLFLMSMPIVFAILPDGATHNYILLFCGYSIWKYRTYPVLFSTIGSQANVHSFSFDTAGKLGCRG
jgi:hypothetical protein